VRMRPVVVVKPKQLLMLSLVSVSRVVVLQLKKEQRRPEAVVVVVSGHDSHIEGVC